MPRSRSEKEVADGDEDAEEIYGAHVEDAGGFASMATSLAESTLELVNMQTTRIKSQHSRINLKDLNLKLEELLLHNNNSEELKRAKTNANDASEQEVAERVDSDLCRVVCEHVVQEDDVRVRALCLETLALLLCNDLVTAPLYHNVLRLVSEGSGGSGQAGTRTARAARACRRCTRRRGRSPS